MVGEGAEKRMISDLFSASMAKLVFFVMRGSFFAEDRSQPQAR
jgi:hypothetical protein